MIRAITYGLLCLSMLFASTGFVVKKMDCPPTMCCCSIADMEAGEMDCCPEAETISVSRSIEVIAHSEYHIDLKLYDKGIELPVKEDPIVLKTPQTISYEVFTPPDPNEVRIKIQTFLL